MSFPSHAEPGPQTRSPHGSGADVVRQGEPSGTHLPVLASDASQTVPAAHGVARLFVQSSTQAPSTHTSPGPLHVTFTQDVEPPAPAVPPAPVPPVEVDVEAPPEP